MWQTTPLLLLCFGAYVHDSCVCCLYFITVWGKKRLKRLRFATSSIDSNSSQQRLQGQVDRDPTQLLTRCSACLTDIAANPWFCFVWFFVCVFAFFFFFVELLSMPAHTSCFATSGLLQHMGADRWTQSDTRHLGNQHLAFISGPTVGSWLPNETWLYGKGGIKSSSSPSSSSSPQTVTTTTSTTRKLVSRVQKVGQVCLPNT